MLFSFFCLVSFYTRTRDAKRCPRHDILLIDDENEKQDTGRVVKVIRLHTVIFFLRSVRQRETT